MLLGLFLGALNGYLLIGSLWYYLHQAGYPTTLVVWPPPVPQVEESINSIVQFLPPAALPIPQIYFAVGVVFVFIIVVFV